MGGDRIRRVIILELQEEDGEVFEDFLSFLQDHPEIENCKQNKDSIISLIHGSAGFSATSRRSRLPKRSTKYLFTYSRTPTMS